jgi:hypothetical protein
MPAARRSACGQASCAKRGTPCSDCSMRTARVPCACSTTSRCRAQRVHCTRPAPNSVTTCVWTVRRLLQSPKHISDPSGDPRVGRSRLGRPWPAIELNRTRSNRLGRRRRRASAGRRNVPRSARPSKPRDRRRRRARSCHAGERCLPMSASVSLASDTRPGRQVCAPTPQVHVT